MTALAFPDAHVSLIFLPWVPLKIGGAVMGAVGSRFLSMSLIADIECAEAHATRISLPCPGSV